MVLLSVINVEMIITMKVRAIHGLAERNGKPHTAHIAKQRESVHLLVDLFTHINWIVMVSLLGKNS